MTELTKSNAVADILARRPHLRPLIHRISVRYGGEKQRDVERFIKFAIVGVIGTVIDLGISNLLMKFVFHVNKETGSTPVLIASVIGFTIAVCSNFIWNRYWTYPDSRSYSVWRQLAQFFAVNIVGLLIRAVVVGLLTTPFTGLLSQMSDGVLKGLSLSSDSIAQLGGNAAILVSISIVLIWNFFINRYWTYNDVK